MDKDRNIIAFLIVSLVIVYSAGLSMLFVNETRERECRIYLATTTALSPTDLVAVCKGK